MRKFLDIPFGKVAERTLYLDALVPEGVSGPNPIVLWLHGGGWYEGNKRNIIDQGALEFLVENGFVVASAEYKLLPEAKFPAQIFDVKAAIRWLRAKPEVLGGDPDRIAIAGFSAGAQLSALAGTTADRPEFEGGGGGLQVIQQECLRSSRLLHPRTSCETRRHMIRRLGRLRWAAQHMNSIFLGAPLVRSVSLPIWPTLAHSLAPILPILDYPRHSG
jgi:acetyl esterase/lipase